MSDWARRQRNVFEKDPQPFTACADERMEYARRPCGVHAAAVRLARAFDDSLRSACERRSAASQSSSHAAKRFFASFSLRSDASARVAPVATVIAAATRAFSVRSCPIGPADTDFPGGSTCAGDLISPYRC
eukprot:5534099-Pleurochrysis_carterae.AAC.1